MKRILGIAMMLGLLGAVTLIAGCSKENSPQTKKEPVTEKVGFTPKEETPTEKVGSTPKKIDKAGEPAQDVADFSDNIFTITLKRGLKKIELEMVLVPAGKFKMGFTKKELAELKFEIQENFKKNTFKKELEKKELDVVDLIMSDQGKQYEVTLSKPFFMGKYEITQEQWEAVMGNNPSSTEGAKGGNFPVTDVSWEDCQDFIKKLNAKTNGGYRLPLEAEWEYACRAGTTTAYSFGDKITPKDANCYTGDIKAVGSYKPNAFGLFDMHGNVGEWCEDWMDDYPAGAVTDPKGPETGKVRVHRGGSAIWGEYNARSSVRQNDSPTNRSNSGFGFRLAKDK